MRSRSRTGRPSRGTLEADITEELYVELPNGYRDSPNQVGRLQKGMYGLMLAGLL